MNILLKALLYVPLSLLRKEILAELFRLTADAFLCPVPTLGRLSNTEYLHAYAQFTWEQANHILRADQDITDIKKRLYQNAYPLGEKLRKWVGIRTMDEVMMLAQKLYQSIKIECQGDCEGNLTVKSCYFSQFYSSQVCDIISALDDGVFSGLSGGGRLTFLERISEGRKCCRARLQLHLYPAINLQESQRKGDLS